jgi:Zinc finger found in FPG and IleRS
MDDFKAADLKYIVSVLDMVEHGYNGFVAPGARVPEQPAVKDICERLGVLKCPRCWNYHTVQGNPDDICDRCIAIINSMLDELVACEKWTPEQVQEWKDAISAMVNRWKAKP